MAVNEHLFQRALGSSRDMPDGAMGRLASGHPVAEPVRYREDERTVEPQERGVIP